MRVYPEEQPGLLCVESAIKHVSFCLQTSCRAIVISTFKLGCNRAYWHGAVRVAHDGGARSDWRWGGLQRALITIKLGVVAGIALLCALFALKFTRVRTMLSLC